MLRTMPYNPDRTGGLFAELAVHDSRESIKRALTAAEELLDLRIDYRSDWKGERVGRAVSLAGRTGELRRDGGSVVVPLRFSDGRLAGELRCVGTEGDPVSDRDIAFLRVLARIVSGQLEAEEEELERRRLHAESLGVQALLAAIDARDHYTGDHSKSVVSLSAQVAQRMELSTRQIAETEQVALLHDVGKVAVPDHILQKSGPLDEHERRLIEEHPVVGAKIVRSIAGLAHLAPAIRAGHERWDGRGYPDGLAGEDIPIVSRITFVCDAFDAMTSDRPYRRSLGLDRARRELDANAAKQFDANAVHALMSVIDSAAA
jgi:HD-GYP domain-containing protein (c-di-GMP phosphodiesterase class II)